MEEHYALLLLNTHKVVAVGLACDLLKANCGQLTFPVTIPFLPAVFSLFLESLNPAKYVFVLQL